MENFNFFVKFIAAILFFRLIKCENITNSINSTEDSSRFMPPPPPFAPPLLYPSNAATGIIVALAVPVVDTDDHNIYWSINFEMNYNMPYCPSESFPGALIRFPGGQGSNTTLTSNIQNPAFFRPTCQQWALPENAKPLTTNKRRRRSYDENDSFAEKAALLTRTGIYHLLEHRLVSNGFDGKKCLLLAICESAKAPFDETNGVIGQIIHIVLTPSTSMDEKLPPEFMKAELAGKAGDYEISNCRKYEQKCPISILGIFSRLIE